MNLKIVSAILLALMAVGVNDVSGQGIIVDAALRRILENIRQLMRTGNPETGMPVLAPYFNEDLFINVSFGGLFEFDTRFTPIRIEGLDEFQGRLQVDLLSLRFPFEFRYDDEITISGFYDMNGRMYGLIPLFGIVSLTSAASIQRSDEADVVTSILEGLNLNDVLIELIEQFKNIMPCGIPSLGVPALVPFELNHTAFKIDKPGLLYFDGEINDLFVDDMNNFDVVNVDLQIFKLKLDFSFLFHSIKTTGKYKAQGKALSFIPFNRSGNFGFNFNGLSLAGSIKVALNGDKLLVEEFKLYPTVKSVNSKFEHVFFLPLTNLIFNKIVESVVPKYLRENQEDVSLFLESYIKPEVNELLGDYTLEDLMGLLQGSENGTIPSTC